MAVKVRLLGAKESAANIRKMDKAVRKALYKEMLSISKEILVRAKQYVPYLTGALERSGRVKGYPGRYPVVYTSFGNAAARGDGLRAPRRQEGKVFGARRQRLPAEGQE